ncbi:MAG TPA: hypothetical protein VFQ36_24665 [Ktedonobacteraceae bacterium]|nr:hypothetical protein [Ktedonobacteraceae bacterium]
MYFQHAPTEQQTLPLSAIAFRRYLATYQIEPLDVALKSGVRYLTVWRIRQGQPVHRQDEMLVRQGLVRMTGVPYTAPLLTRADTEAIDIAHKSKIKSPGRMSWG